MNDLFVLSKDRKSIFFNKKNDDIFVAFTTKKIKTKKQAEKVLKTGHINIVKQTHSDRIIVVKKRGLLRGVKADGIITNLKNFPIAVKVADCIGSIIIDSEKMVVAAIHSGWRGVVLKIISKTVKIMKNEFGSRPDRLIVITSASIGPCCYEVGRNLYIKLRKQKVFSNIFINKNKKIFMDIQKANKNILLSSGVKKNNIFINSLCTRCNNDLFFHTEQKEEKREECMR